MPRPPSTSPLVSSVCSECGGPLEFELGTLQVRCDHCSAGLVVDRGLRLLRLDCPRCGGNFYYLDGSLCGRCPYCDATLLAVTHDRLLRFLVRPVAPRPAAAEQATLTLLPFWHLSGLVLGWDIGARVEFEEELALSGDAEGGAAESSPAVRKDSGPQRAFRGRVVDLPLPDPATRALGVTSLRLRGAVFPLEPFRAESEGLGRVVPAALPVDRAREELLGRALGHGGRPTEGMTRLDCQRQELVAERLSLFYYPFWVHEEPGGTLRAWDGVTGEPEVLGIPVAASSGTSAVWDELAIIELTCGVCGATLAPGNRALVLPCAACGAFWRVTRQGLERCVAHRARTSRTAPRTAWLPFWRVEVQVRYAGREATRARHARELLGVLPPLVLAPATAARRDPVRDAVRLVAQAPLSTVAAPTDPDAPLVYYVPAYGGLRAPKLDVAARDLTRVQPALEELPAAGAVAAEASETFSCFYDEEDARQLGYVTWIQLLPTVVTRLRSLRVTPGATTLWYLPFADHRREVENLLTGARYDWSVFRGLRH